MGQESAWKQASPVISGREVLEAIYRQLFDHYGPQHWWPTQTPFEVMVGAVLTQNTAWNHVERAIENLRRADLLDPAAISAVKQPVLVEYLRPAGYFNVKAKRLQALSQFLLNRPGLEKLETAELRQQLLSIHGIGQETADDILLYAFQRPVFVIDAYTRRLLGRLGVMDEKASYEVLSSGFEKALRSDTQLFNEYHALIVVHAKHVCRKKPSCETCCLRQCCDYSDNL
ncbi:MAG: endonuclease III domain-containing protein [Candidatus Thiodiazotropha sp. (ex Gloverina cf. vestifex)]|nr:endonuclease III domain-containing protein [Candidatus Thiodiazotropha sp. (ex Gloverina cf. vestifex)]